MNDSSPPLEAWNPSSSGTASTIPSFICNVCSCIRAPIGYRLAAQQFVYHSHTASLNLWNFPWRFRFLLSWKLAYYLRSFSLFFIIVAADVFSILKISAIPLQLIFGIFPCNWTIVIFRLSTTPFSAINHWISFWKETSLTSLSTLFLISLFCLLTRKEIWKDFLSSYNVLKNAMVLFKLLNQTWNDNIWKVYFIAKLYTKNNLVAGVLNLLNKIWRKKMFYNWSSTVKTFLLSLILI